ncbi:MAG: SBBP repeat-containing protein, partial [Bacteroidota bacterium]
MTHTPLHAHAGTSLNRIVRLTRSVSGALFFGFFLLISVSSALGQTAGGPIDPSIKELLNTYEHKIYFTENRGQFKERVLYRADFPYGQAAATAEGMYISTYDPASVQARMDDGELLEREIQNGQRIRPLNGRLKGHTWLMNFVGRSAGMTTSGAERHGDFYNYFTGNTSRHATGVANYQEVWYNNVYNNVDVRYYPAEDGTLEYDIVCKPGFRPTDIRIRFDGIDRLKVKEDGSLLFETSVGSVEFPAPVVYQQINGTRKTIAAAYRVRENNVLSFELGEYDVNAPMIIDPIALRWATWVNTASSGDNHGHCIWVDPSDGAIYMVARVVGTTDQITIGAFDELANGNLEMIVGKYLEPVNIGEAGTRVWQTYIGGNNDDNPYAMEQGPDGNLYITGYTGSTNFPLLGGTGFSGSSIDNQSQSGNDIFIL